MATTSAVDLIAGVWVSNFGRVQFTCRECEEGIILVTGFWGTAEQKKGVIDSGTFDRHNNILEFYYTEIYRGAAGDGELQPGNGRIFLSLTETISSILRVFFSKTTNG